MPTINRLPKKTRLTENSEKRNERHELYDTRKWRKLRLEKLRNNPICQICEQKNIITVAIDIHHIISFMITENMDERKELFYNYENLQSLCKQCHNEIHNKKY